MYIVSVVSYKRPYNNTCKLLSQYDLNWNVFVYSFDPYIEEYKRLYGKHVHELTFETANLAKKRQEVLNSAIRENYKYCIMLDDDILNLTLNGNNCSIKDAIDYLMYSIKNSQKYVALSAAYNLSNTDLEISSYKNICNNSVFNLDIYKNSNVVYNQNSKCEDMEFTIDLILKGYLTGKLEKIIIKNDLQGGTTNDGLSYRFKNTNRFIEEGSYMRNKYKNISDVFEYDENHFKMNSSKLIDYLKEELNEN